MVYDLAWSSGWRWGRGKQGGGVGMGLSIGFNGGRRALGEQDAIGTNHWSSGAAAVIAVELEVAFSSTVATVDVFGSRIWSFFQ
jgi:hypothetical protein